MRRQISDIRHQISDIRTLRYQKSDSGGEAASDRPLSRSRKSLGLGVGRRFVPSFDGDRTCPDDVPSSLREAIRA
jgi:hypothetical protein